MDGSFWAVALKRKMSCRTWGNFLTSISKLCLPPQGTRRDLEGIERARRAQEASQNLRELQRVSGSLMESKGASEGFKDLQRAVGSLRELQ